MQTAIPRLFWKTKKEKIVNKTNLRNIFMYSEDGKTFYEFFSGRYIGEMRVNNAAYRAKRRLLVRGDCILTTFDDWGTLDYDIQSVTAAKFADIVKPYTPYLKHVASEMSKFLDAIDAAWLKTKHREASAQRAKEQAENDSQSWLDSIINSHK